MSALAVTRIAAHVFRWPVETPVRTSFGVMHDRPMVLVEAEGEGGLRGWGEVWCNFPSVGAEHRARLVGELLGPMVVGAAPATPAETFERLTRATEVLAIQAGEPGPLAQCIAGIDIALWDLAARRAGEPLWMHLGGSRRRVPVYASGLNPDAPEKLAARRRDEGYRAFKLKVGFGEARDVANLRALRDTLGPHAPLMVDANQAWTVEEAARMAPKLQPFDLRWLEEPLRADRPAEDWRALRAACSIPIAAGENIAGAAQFGRAIASGLFDVVQPDMAKWGGFSGCLPVAREAIAAGRLYCPHYLGGGVGLLASAHLLAAAGGDGMLEVDANPNPLREETCGALARIVDGHAGLEDTPGLGVEPDLARLARLCR